ncbi:MAG TPA: hypothetical protein VIY73_02610 [Polyangiaceae bacterium]
MKLIDVVEHVRALTEERPYAVIGGLAQILWARKSHTDDVDVAVAAPDLLRAYERVRGRKARGWRLPEAPDEAHEADAVFEVYHLLYRGSVVDLIAFRDEALMAEILSTARAVPELGGMRFVRPELLLATHLLRPGAVAALAAVELVLARREKHDCDVDYARTWARAVGREPAFERTLERAADLEGT